MKSKDEDGWRLYGTGPTAKISVTTVLDGAVAKPSLTKWYKKTSEKQIAKTVDAAADFGTNAHAVFESMLKDEDVEVPDELKPHANAFKQWYLANKVVPKHLEVELMSEELGIAGTADFIGTVNGVEFICDWKTGRTYSITTGYQLCAYRRMAIEMGLVSDKCQVMGIHIPRDTGKLKPVPYEHIDWCEKMFLHALELFKGLYFYKLQALGWVWLHKEARYVGTSKN